MRAGKISAFDAMAADYDNSFSRSLTGQAQREQVRTWLGDFLKDKTRLNILEINCGTGDDAIWLSSLGHRVVATDTSEAMITEARKKSSFAISQLVQFTHCAFADLPAALAYEKFDLVFSNFSGLNCVAADELSLLNQQLYNLLKPGGHIAAVIFGKYNWWETIYFLLKGKPGKAFRRWRKKPSVSELKEGVFQEVYYYSASRFCRLFNRFKKTEARPVGLFVPPSYLESFMQKNPGWFRSLEKFEKKAGGISAFSQFADHQYLLLKKV